MSENETNPLKNLLSPEKFEELTKLQTLQAKFKNAFQVIANGTFQGIRAKSVSEALSFLDDTHKDLTNEIVEIMPKAVPQPDLKVVPAVTEVTGG